MKNDNNSFMISFILGCFFTILIIWLTSCEHNKSDFIYINGKPHYVKNVCVDWSLEHNFTGPEFTMECDSFRLDTIEMKETQIQKTFIY